MLRRHVAGSPENGAGFGSCPERNGITGILIVDFRFRQLKPSIVDEGAMAVGFVSRAEVEARYHEVAK